MSGRPDRCRVNELKRRVLITIRDQHRTMSWQNASSVCRVARVRLSPGTQRILNRSTCSSKSTPTPLPGRTAVSNAPADEAAVEAGASTAPSRPPINAAAVALLSAGGLGLLPMTVAVT